MRYIVGQLSTMPSFCHVIARQCDHFCNGCSLSKQVSWHSSSHGDESGLTIGLMYFPMGPTNLWKETKNENVPVGLFLELTNVGLWQWWHSIFVAAPALTLSLSSHSPRLSRCLHTGPLATQTRHTPPHLGTT